MANILHGAIVPPETTHETTMRHALPVYTKQHLYDAIPTFFQRVSYYRDAKTHCAIGQPKPDLVRQLSYFVARIAHRTPVRVTALQKSRPGDRHNIYARTYWCHSYYSYGVFSLQWDSEQPRQLSHHATKAEAVQALTAL